MLSKKVILAISIIFISILCAAFYLYRNQYLILKSFVDKDSDLGQLMKMEELNASYLSHNQLENGLFNYLVDPVEAVSKNDENYILRQALATDYFSERSSLDRSTLNVLDKNLEGIFSFWYRTETKDGREIGRFERAGFSTLGDSGIMLKAISISPNARLYSDKAEKIADGILSLQNNDGSFKAFFKKPEDNVINEETQLRFFSGEAILGLLKYYEYTNDKKYFLAAKAGIDYYTPKYLGVLKTEELSFQFVPWYLQVYLKAYQLTGDKKYYEYASEMADSLLDRNFDDKVYEGNFSKDTDIKFQNSAANAVYAEGLSHALYFAQQMNDENRVQKYRNALILSLRFIKEHIYTEKFDSFGMEPDKYLGGLRINSSDQRIQVDGNGHLGLLLLFVIKNKLFTSNTKDLGLPLRQTIYVNKLTSTEMKMLSEREEKRQELINKKFPGKVSGEIGTTTKQ